jgi:acetyltransferase EpsM
MSAGPGRQRLAILGAGSFAEEVADLVSEMPQHELVAFVEGTDRSRCAERLAGLPVVWIDDVAELASSCRAVCAVGTPRRKGFIRRAAARGLDFATVVHPSARVSRTATLGPGTIVSAGSIIGAHTTIGEHVIINRGCLIGHHTAIGDCTTISPGANIAGRVRVGGGCYVGMGAIILDGLAIGRDTVVGAGAVVTRDVPDDVRVVGVPARAVKVMRSR